MGNGKIFGPIEIIGGFYFILAHFGLFKNLKLFGYNFGVIASIVILGSIIFNYIYELITGHNKTMETFVAIFFGSFPLIYLFNELVTDMVTGTAIAESYLLIMGLASIINGILRFF